MKAPRIIRRMLRVEYRLTTISHGKAVSVYCTDRKTLKGTLARMTDIEYWTIYKRGPLWLPERTVDFGQKD